MKHLRPIEEKKPKGAPDWHDSDAPDANGRFRDLSIKDLAAWLIKTRKKDVKRISGSLTQQIVFNRNDDPKYAEKMEKTRKEVYRQLGREDLLESIDMDDLENAKERLSNPHTILDITYDKTRRGDKFVRFDYENKHVPGKMWDRGPHFVNVRYDNNKDLKKISKELGMDLKESIVNEAKSFSQSELKSMAQIIADATAKVDKTKAKVVNFEMLDTPGRIAGFYIQKATNRFGAPSRYWITDSGEVVKAFRYDTLGPEKGTIAHVGDKLADVVKTFKMDESMTAEKREDVGKVNEKILLIMKDVISKMVGAGFSYRTDPKMRDEMYDAISKAIVPILKDYGYAIKESKESDELAIAINDAILDIDDSMSYKDFAEAVAKVIKDEYGSHLYKPFQKQIERSLKESIISEEKVNRKKLSHDLWDRKGYDYKYLDKLSDKKLKALWDTEFYYESVSEANTAGEDVWNHIVSITPEEDDIPWGFQDKIEGNNFKLTKVDLKKLLKSDPDFAAYYKGGEERYDQDEVDEFDVYNELVVVDGELLDGYSRAARLLRQGEKKANAFINEAYKHSRTHGFEDHRSSKEKDHKYGKVKIERNTTFIEFLDLIANHKFDAYYSQLIPKDQKWVEKEAEKQGFTEKELKRLAGIKEGKELIEDLYYQLMDKLYEAKPGPDAYMTGLSDKEKEAKKAKMKKQAEMDDDDPDSYEEMPGDKEARESGKVKKSKHTTAYHKKFKKESMTNIKSFDSFISEKKHSDLWSPYQKADVLAGDMFGEMGLFSLTDDQLDQIIDLKKADKLAKKMFGEFGFKTLAAKEMEDLLDSNPKLLRESIALSENLEEAFIGPFVFNDRMSDEELLGMYNGALDGYSYYAKGMQYPKSDYKKAYQEIEKILKKRGVTVDESIEESEQKFKKGDKVEYKQLFGIGSKQDWVTLTGVVTKVKNKKKSPFGRPAPHQELTLQGGAVISPYTNHKDIKLAESIINEAKRSTIHKAAKKGSYPVTIVVIKDGEVIAQELVKTPQSVPATFNVLQSYHKHKGATVRIESRTGETLFQESIGVNERFNEYSFKFGRKGQFGIDDVNVAYGFWGTLEMHYDEEQVSIAWEDAFDSLIDIYKFSEEGALYYLNSRAGRHLADKFAGGEFYNLEDTMEDYANKGQWKKWAKEYNQYAVEENVKEALLIEKITVASIIDAAEMEMETPGINKTHLKQIIRRKKENRLYTIDSKAEKTLRKLLGKYKIEEAETLAELQKMSKKEWKKTKAFNKHITKAGDKYVMAYDDKIGTYLDPVEIIDEGLFNDEDTENYDDALETAKKYGIPIAVAVATIAAMGLAGAIALFKKGARKVAQWVDRNADAIPESIKAIALEESSLLIEDEQTTNDQSPLGDEGMETGIKNKAKESGVPVGLLRIIMRRGLAAWKTGHRPGATQAQWGYARVNSFLTKQPGTWGKADSDIAKKVRDGGHDKNL